MPDHELPARNIWKCHKDEIHPCGIEDASSYNMVFLL